MSEADRKKWDARYTDGAYERRAHPSAYLETIVPERLWGPGRALDVACGRGRNSYYMAGHGFTVDGVDVSGVALDQAERGRGDLPIRWHRLDLDAGLPLDRGAYDLVIMVRFVSAEMLSLLPEFLAPGGLLMVEEHLNFETDRALSGPGNPRFRVAPGELEAGVEGLEVLERFEGLVEEPDGARAALARILARRPGAS